MSQDSPLLDISPDVMSSGSYSIFDPMRISPLMGEKSRVPELEKYLSLIATQQ